MTKEDFFELAARHASGKCTPDESRLVEKYYEILQQRSSEPNWDALNEKDLKLKIYNSIERKIQKQISYSPKIRVFWPNLRKLAAIFIFLFLSAMGAFWVMGSLTFKENPSMMEIINPAQRSSQFRLPDGSKVWLGVASKLEYQKDFTGELREVELSGEAYFEVVHDISRPFIVKVKDMHVKVLGTSFNVSAYADDSPAVVLESGSVQVFQPHNSTETTDLVLSPGQRAVFDKTQNTFKINEVDVQVYTAWKVGVLKFNGISLEKVAQILERWYGVKVIFESKTLKACSVKAEYDNESLENVLKSLSYILEMNYVIEGDSIKLQGKGC